MSKKVIRLTESELKRMIKNIISEQAAPAAGAPNMQILSSLKGKNAMLYADANKSQAIGVHRIVSTATGKVVNGTDTSVILVVQDMRFVTNTGTYNDNGMEAIIELSMSCDGQKLYAHNNKRQIKQVFCPALEAKLKEALNCANINRNVDFASAGGKAPSDFA